MPTTATRVLVLARDGGGAQGFLEAAPDFHVMVAESVADAMLAVAHSHPQVLVAALSSPVAEDASAVKRLLDCQRGLPLLVVSHPAGEERVVELIKAGASGYLFSIDTRYVATAVRELLRGGVPMSAPVSQLVMQRARRSSATMAAVRPSELPAPKLTGRQRELLKLLQRGHSYEDIGAALDVSVNTVRSHVRAVYERLGASTKVEAVMIAMELGILERPRLSAPAPA